MFRLENHMPEYWENESRDFQLLTRIDDMVFMGQRADIATIQNLNSSKKCKNSFLPLLAKKVGFFTKESIEDKVLRNIIGAFRTAVKHKGTKLGIVYAVTAILKAENSTGVPEVRINPNGDYTIDILTPIPLINKVALKEFLRYVVPTGYKINIYSYASNVPNGDTKVSPESDLNYAMHYTRNIGNIRGNSSTSIVDENNPDTIKIKHSFNDIRDSQLTASDYPEIVNADKDPLLLDDMPLLNLYSGLLNIGTIVSKVDYEKGTLKDSDGKSDFRGEETSLTGINSTIDKGLILGDQ